MNEGIQFNHEDVFALIKVLEVNNDIQNNGIIFLDAMSKNYHMSENDALDSLFDDEIDVPQSHEMIHKDLETYQSLTFWDEREPSEIDNLPIGTVFKGISKVDSQMRTYAVVGKVNDKSIWFPIDERAYYMCILSVFNEETGRFDPIDVDSIDMIKLLLAYDVEPNKLYQVMDFKDNAVCLDDDDDDFDEENALESLYFVYKKDEDENGFVTVAKMRETAANLQIFRPLFNQYTEIIRANNNTDEK